MSNLYIVVNRNNADRNSLNDIAAAVGNTGATVLAIDEHNHLIEASVPIGEVPTISNMDGVSYVRSVFNYFCNVPTPLKAA